MISIRHITRSLGWQPAGNTLVPAGHESARARSGGPQVQIAGNVVRLPPRVDAALYPAVAGAAARVYAEGHPSLVLDLGEVTHLGTAGVFTLHAVAMIMRGQNPPDPEGGWHALRAVAEANRSAGRQERVVALRPSPAIEARLRANQLDRCLVIAY